MVGAGPAGSTAAYILAKSGCHVLLLDKRNFPRDKLCGGLITRKTVLLLEGLFQTSIEHLTTHRVILNRSTRYGVNLRARPCFRGKLEYPFHFIDRNIYDAFWLDRACKAGAEFRSGDKVISLDPSSSQVTTVGGHQYSGKYIIGADGALSRIRRLLVAGGHLKCQHNSGLATALETVVSANQAPALPDYPLIDLSAIRWGYAWCFPRQDLRVLGICGLNQKSGKYLKAAMARFLRSVNMPAGNVGAVKSHALPYGNFLIQPGSRNILLVGDAGGLADPLLGEGIYYAHKSGQLAASAAIRARRSSHKAVKLYGHYLSETIIPELKFVRIVRGLIFSLPGFWPGRILSFILKINSRKCEETIQGQRSFRWLRPLSPPAAPNPSKPKNLDSMGPGLLQTGDQNSELNQK